MKLLLLLDKDGTLINPRRTKFVEKPWDQTPIEGVNYALNNLYKDWRHVVISNQGGIAAGHKSLSDTFLEMEFCAELFPSITDIFFCPDFEGKECWKMWAPWEGEDHRILYDAKHTDTVDADAVGQFRKPGVGMIKLAMHLLGEFDGILYVGDRDEDEQAAKNAGVEFMHAHVFQNLI